MFIWIAKRYEGNKDKLYSNYNKTLFSRSKDKEVLKVLSVILGLKIEIEIDEVVIRMAYNIIKAYICYDFIIFLFEEMKKNLENIEQGDFRYSYYL